MINEKIHNRQLVLLLFMIRSSVVIGILPVLTIGEAAQDAWLAAVITLAGTLLFVLLIGGLSVRFPEETVVEYSRRLVGNFSGTVISLAFLWLYLHIAATDVRIYAELLATAFLPRTPPVLIISAMVFLAAVAAALGIETMGRTADALVFFFVLFIVASLLGTVKAFEIKNLQPVLGRGFGPVLSGAVTPIAMGAQFLSLGILVPSLTQPRKALVSALLAVALSGVVLILSAIMVVGVIGPEIGRNAPFPFFLMTRGIEITRFLERIEALGIISWGFGLLIDVAVFLYCGAVGLARLVKLRDYRPLLGPMAVIWVLLAVHTYEDFFAVQRLFQPRLFSLYIAVFVVLPYLILWLAYLLRKPGRKKPQKNTRRNSPA